MLVFRFPCILPNSWHCQQMFFYDSRGICISSSLKWNTQLNLYNVFYEKLCWLNFGFDHLTSCYAILFMSNVIAVFLFLLDFYSISMRKILYLSLLINTGSTKKVRNIFKIHTSRSNWENTMIFFAKYSTILRYFLDVLVSQPVR